MPETDDTHRNAGRDHDTQREEQQSRWEVLTAAVGLLLLLLVMGFLGYQAFGTESSPPLLHIQVDSTVPATEGTAVHFRVLNRGAATAADVLVEGEVQRDDGSVEKSESTFDYVPADGSRAGTLLFSSRPVAAPRLRAVSFRQP